MAARRANGRGVRVQTWPEEVGPEPGGIEGSRFMGGQAWQGGSRPKIGHRLRPTSEVNLLSVYIGLEQDRPHALVGLI